MPAPVTDRSLLPDGPHKVRSVLSWYFAGQITEGVMVELLAELPAHPTTAMWGERDWFHDHSVICVEDIWAQAVEHSQRAGHVTEAQMEKIRALRDVALPHMG